MILLYLKQAWLLLKQNKLYSTIYIVGTGLAIAMTMTIAIVFYIKMAPVYPETNRNRTLTAKYMRINYPERGGQSSAGFSYQFVKDYFYTLEIPEVVTAVLQAGEDYPLVESIDKKSMIPAEVKYTDDKFWHVFNFQFLKGKPFQQIDFESAIKTAVISSSFANKLFGTVDIEGKYINIDGDDFRISGVVRDASSATPETFGHIWVPYTVKPEDLKSPNWGEGYLGPMKIFILAETASDKKDIIEEVESIVQKINAATDKYNLSLTGQPESHWKSIFRKYSNKAIDWGEVFKTFGLLLAAFLIIPAVNLAGMVSSRMEKRLPEMGIRKVFGASRITLLNQVLTENLLFTVLGGIAGLFFSYLIVYNTRTWILTIFDSFPSLPQEGSETFFTFGMLFNPMVFFITFGICFILNFLSAIIPAYNGLKKGIIYSLNNNR
ncbi:MAG: ABC transporter permease [Bacteroides sp.]|nr:ABC transporter permease [Bacteroides sp.]